jgi:hypothetical protein
MRPRSARSSTGWELDDTDIRKPHVIGKMFLKHLSDALRHLKDVLKTSKMLKNTIDVLSPCREHAALVLGRSPS